LNAANEVGALTKFAMPGLVPGIHVFRPKKEDVDGRDNKPGHDEKILEKGQ
jgi:hypothetical protein